jgi:hypothetical protein
MSERLPEFPSDWHQEAHIEATRREIDGCKRRLLELKDMNAHGDVIADAEQALENARRELKRFSPSQKTASKRPAKSSEERIRTTDERIRKNDSEDRDDGGRDLTGPKGPEGIDKKKLRGPEGG